MSKLADLTVEELRMYKQYLIGEIKNLQKQTRAIDERIKELLSEVNNDR